MNKTEKINQKIFFVLLSITVSVFFAACVSGKKSTGIGPLIIQEQGSFAVGGTVITNPGTPLYLSVFSNSITDISLRFVSQTKQSF